jgi:drug/metabolite transporter (DMT)-like permease
MKTGGVVLALVAALSWSISAVFSKVLMATINPVSMLVIVGLAYAVILAGMAVIWWRVIRPDMALVLASPKLSAYIVALILSGFLIPYWIYYALMRDHPSYSVIALTYTVPAFTLLWAFYILREKINIWGALGVIMIVVGALLTVANE